MASPKFFEELLSTTSCPIGIVSNLKGFYLSPNKWKEILSNERIKVATSFQELEMEEVAGQEQLQVLVQELLPPLALLSLLL